jgi:predicted nucleic acid-binding protein
MAVVFDNSFLTPLYGPFSSIAIPQDPATGQPVTRAEDRVAALVETLGRGQERILIPTPVLCEFLTVAGRDGTEYLERFDSSSRFQIVPFDARAAIEAAQRLQASRRSRREQGRGSSPWQEVKFDHQIVAIARVRAANTIYSDDEDIAGIAADSGIDVITLAELPLPPPTQADLLSSTS